MSLTSKLVIIGPLHQLLRSNLHVFILDDLMFQKVLHQGRILKFTTSLDLADECDMRIVVDLLISGSNRTEDTLIELEVTLKQLELRLRVKEIV